MRILAIRGKNLASLAGEFVLDFQSEPLASAGLYAITGATGSGKSTLLDALCLALYEQTPRLSGIAGSGTLTDVGSNAITAADVRTILRRGCSEGFAEVDFIGSNSVAYRSRWSVRRAHGKASGKLQHSEISLIRISDGQALGDTRKTETLRLIESYVGLSFAQFTRAVLLAQNDFTAFLKASDDARAELLQTLTGTENYEKISKLAFERMKAEKEKLAQFQAQWQALAPPTAEQSREIVAQLQAQSDQLDASAQQKSVTESHLRWYQLGDQLQQEEANAQQILASALSTKNAAAVREVQLALLDKVQSARELCAELARLQLAEAQAAQTHALAQNELARTSAAYEASALQQAQAHQQCRNTEVARLHAQTELDAAKALDARIGTIMPQVQAAQLECSTAAQQLQIELSQQAQTRAQLYTNESKLAVAQQWLANNQDLRPLAESWQRWETLFDEAQNILNRQAKLDTHVAYLKREIAAFEINFSSASEAQILATQALKLTQAQLSQLSAEISAFDIEQMRVEKAALDISHEQVQSALTLWPKLWAVHSQMQKQRQLLLLHSETLSADAEVLRACLENLPVLECAEQVANESLQLASLALSENVESMRAGLQPDQACPVCGARTHPYAQHAPAADMLKSLQVQLNAKKKQLEETKYRINSAQESKARAEQAIVEIQLLLSELDDDYASLSAEWACHSMRGELEGAPESQRLQKLSERQINLRSARDRLRAQEAQYWAIYQHKEAVRAQVDADNDQLATANEKLRNLDAARASAKQNLSTALRDLAELTLQLATKQRQIDEALPAPIWRVEWRQNPNAFVTLKRAAVQIWAVQLAEVTTLITGIAQFQIKLSACEYACLQAQAQHTNRREKHAALALELQTYLQRRSALFAGKLVAQIEAELNGAVLEAKTALTASDALLLTAHAELARTQEALSQGELTLEQGRSKLDAARLELDGWLALFNAQAVAVTQNLTLPALHSLLKITPEWRANERAALQELGRAVHTAQAVVDARTESRRAHGAQQSAVEAVEILQTRLAQLHLECNALSESVAGLKLEMAFAAERARQAEALLVKIQAQTADARVWSQLGELIGSADGKKFRNFAQQLTLDILLSYANLHLQTLTRRYRVQRINDSLGLLVVDQDMGDEVRSVHSLSGGESFLLSLALALGLASLSSHRVQVESLFIDEGFGSLDAESLSIAMEALDNLQSQGRKVGVISHLQELTERIEVKVQLQRQPGGLSKIVIR